MSLNLHYEAASILNLQLFYSGLLFLWMLTQSSQEDAPVAILDYLNTSARLSWNLGYLKALLIRSPFSLKAIAPMVYCGVSLNIYNRIYTGYISIFEYRNHTKARAQYLLHEI